MRKGWLVLLVFALSMLAWDAPAQTRRGWMKQVEASMLVKGRIDVSAEGYVTGYMLDDPHAAGAEVQAHLDRHLSAWKLVPAMEEGRPVASSAKFSVRVVAKRSDAERTSLAIVAAHIDDGLPEEARVRRAHALEAPAYPRDMAKLGASGVVYVLVKVDRQGQVVDAHAERVNLTVLAPAQVAGGIRQRLATTALAVAPRWTFRVPDVGPYAGEDFHVVRVPVEFSLVGGERKEGWTVYLPGERSRPAWTSRDDGGNEAALPGRAMLAGSGMRLLTGFEPGQG